MKTRTKSLVMVAMVLGFGTLAFLGQSGVGGMRDRARTAGWAPGERPVPPVSDVNAARIADLPPSLLTQARW